MSNFITTRRQTAIGRNAKGVVALSALVSAGVGAGWLSGVLGAR